MVSLNKIRINESHKNTFQPSELTQWQRSNCLRWIS